MENESAFWELLREGQTCEVRSWENDLIYLGKLHLTEQKVTVEVEEATGAPVPPVLFNTKVKLKVYLSGQGGRLLEGLVCGSTPTFWRLDHLRPLHEREKRQSFRQRVHVSGKVMCVSSIYLSSMSNEPPEVHSAAPELQRTLVCQVEDLSLGGALIRCREAYEVGDWLLVMDVNLPGSLPFTFTCQVRWTEEVRVGEWEYGCQFSEMAPKEQDRLFQTIFELQRKDVQSRRHRV